HIFLSAKSFQNGLCHSGVVIVCKNRRLLSLQIIVFTAGCLQVKFHNFETEYHIEHEECCSSQRKDHPGILCRGQGCGEQKIRSSGGEAEACAESNQRGDYGENAVQQSVNHIQSRRKKHEPELKRLCYTADKRTYSCGSDKS